MHHTGGIVGEHRLGDALVTIGMAAAGRAAIARTDFHNTHRTTS
jgi:hypothetical protein